MAKIKFKGKELEIADFPIDEIIKRYSIVNPSTMPDKIVILNTYTFQHDSAAEDVKKLKPQIMARLKEMEKEREQEEAKRKMAYEERKAKIASIPGLKEIKNAICRRQKWHDDLNRSFDDVGGVGVGVKPKYNFPAAYRKYPRAYAYLRAEEQSNRSNSRMAMIGKCALERIIDGDDYQKVIDDMEAETKKVTKEHMEFYD